VWIVVRREVREDREAAAAVAWSGDGGGGGEGGVRREAGGVEIASRAFRSSVRVDMAVLEPG